MHDLFDDLKRRELIQDSTDLDALRRRISRPLVLYYGCDPTAPSLHIGNLIGLVMLRRFQDEGHRPIALAGGATGMIGDPGGRSEERNLLDRRVLAKNKAAIKKQIARILGPEGPWELVDNNDWTKDLRALSFLRDVGKHFTVSQMLARESVSSRLNSEQGISYTEFSYMLLQANDYAWLHEHQQCELQIGGSDQWGNMLSGVDLIRRRTSQSVHALCWPLLTAEDGSKLGKTSGARVWLDPARTSPYAFFQHWMNTNDAALGRMLAQFTLLPMDEVDKIVQDHHAAPASRAGQRKLAMEVTTLVHGPEAASRASQGAGTLFRGDPRGASAEELLALAEQVPRTRLQKDEDLVRGVDLPAVLLRVGLVRSLSDARRLIRSGAVSVNGAKVPAERALGPDDVLQGGWIVLRKGKRDWAVVEVAGGP